MGAKILENIEKINKRHSQEKEEENLVRPSKIIKLTKVHLTHLISSHLTIIIYIVYNAIISCP
jgi:cell division protein FtsL